MLRPWNIADGHCFSTRFFVAVFLRLSGKSESRNGETRLAHGTRY